MPNAEGRMETLERVRDWWQRLAMSARPVYLDGDDIRVIAAESANALAARTREVEEMRADLDAVRKVEEWHKGGRRILHCEDGHWTALELVADRESPVGASLGGYYRRRIYASGDSYAALGRALAAQEGTR